MSKLYSHGKGLTMKEIAGGKLKITRSWDNFLDKVERGQSHSNKSNLYCTMRLERKRSNKRPREMSFDTGQEQIGDFSRSAHE